MSPRVEEMMTEDRWVTKAGGGGNKIYFFNFITEDFPTTTEVFVRWAFNVTEIPGTRTELSSRGFYETSSHSF